MTRRAEPVRTCVGCRARAAKSDLLRVVVAEHEEANGFPAASSPAGRPVARLVPDLRGRRPGRGAHVHPEPDCLALAERRRAFGRALRYDGPLDLTAVHEQVASATGTTPGTTDGSVAERAEHDT